MELESQINELLESCEHLLSNMLPSEWAEENRVMTKDVSPFPGRFSFNRTPYLREVLDCISPNHPAHTIVTMKGAQIGFSTGVIENGIGYIIAENPGNTLFLTGHTDLAEEAMSGKIDQMIDSCGLRPMIRPNVLRKKNQRTGDTNKSKEFPGGSLTAGSAGNHKLLRQRSVRFGFIDDFDAAKKSTKESGTTTEMIQQRFAAYADKRKLFYISTPEVKQTSNIEPVYLLGDQRKYYVPCPCCGDFIVYEWSVQVEDDTCGIVYERDENGDLVEGSVGYKCQSCKEIFDDSLKQEMLESGIWKATAKPSEAGYYSYHLSSLYAPPGMYDWEYYVRQYIKANPINAPQKVKEMQTFVNLVLGETYEEQGEAPKANQLQKNTRQYEVGEVPEKLSQDDGNGSIVLITCACDLNGKVEDARIDYEILAWSESGSCYSVKHGSIGTFIPNESHKKVKKDRLHWSYVHSDSNSVWGDFDKILGEVYATDTSRNMRIGITGVDTGHYTNFAYEFIAKTNNNVIGLKGKDGDRYRRFGIDTSTFRRSKERSDLYLVEVNQIKDDLAEYMKLRWSENSGSDQPANFMNFPIPSGGAYLYNNFYSHFEAEYRIIDKDKNGDGVSARWVKKNSVAQNHLWDCRVYNIALRHILTDALCREMKMKTFGWSDYVDIVLGRK